MTKEQVRQMYAMVKEFNETAETTASDTARDVQLRLIIEELGELFDGVLCNNWAEVLDACCDLLYVCYGELWLDLRITEVDNDEHDYDHRDYIETRTYSENYSEIICSLERIFIYAAGGQYNYLLMALEDLLSEYKLDKALFPCFKAIHENNMTKFANGVIKDVRGKIMKPAGYVSFDCAKWIQEWETENE